MQRAWRGASTWRDEEEGSGLLYERSIQLNANVPLQYSMGGGGVREISLSLSNLCSLSLSLSGSLSLH